MSVECGKDVLFFDFDGMLIDLQVGIIVCIVYVLQKMDYLVLLQEILLGWIGLLLCIIFVLLFVELVWVEQVVGYYWECFDVEGWCEYMVYLQVEGMLCMLYGCGYWLVVVIVKNELYVCCIFVYLLFGGLFEEIVGLILDGLCSYKLELVGEVLCWLQVQFVQCWMIGDWGMDIEGVCYYGLCSVGVLWGFGGEVELMEVGVSQLVCELVQLEMLLVQFFVELSLCLVLQNCFFVLVYVWVMFVL